MRCCALQLLSTLSLMTAAFAADPWIGSWKMNRAESQLPRGEVEVTFQDGAYHVRPTVGTPLTLVPDGQFRKIQGRETEVSLRRVGDRAMEQQFRTKGVVVMTWKWTVSPDGKRATVETHQTHPDGSVTNTTSVSDRLSGVDKDPFVGRWVENLKASKYPDRIVTYKAEGTHSRA